MTITLNDVRQAVDEKTGLLWEKFSTYAGEIEYPYDGTLVSAVTILEAAFNYKIDFAGEEICQFCDKDFTKNIDHCPYRGQVVMCDSCICNQEGPVFYQADPRMSRYGKGPNYPEDY